MKRRFFCILAIASLLVAVGYGQKKPSVSYYWTVEIVPNTVGPTIVGGPDRNSTERFTYSPTQSTESTTITTSATECSKQCGNNTFLLRLTNLDPNADKQPDTNSPGEWISFRDISMGSSDFSSLGPPSPNVNKLAPIGSGPVDSDYEWPLGAWTTADQSAHAEFMNRYPHPLRYYSAVLIQIQYVGDSFMDMTPNTSMSIDAKFTIAIWSKRDCNAPHNTGIGGSFPPAGQKATLTRTDENVWQIDFAQPVKLYEFGYESITTQRGNKTFESCNMYLKGGWWTQPIANSLIFTRKTN